MDVLGDFGEDERGSELSQSTILWRVILRLAIIVVVVIGGLAFIRLFSARSGKVPNEIEAGNEWATDDEKDVLVHASAEGLFDLLIASNAHMA